MATLISEIHQPADSPSAAVTVQTQCKANPDGKFFSESVAKSEVPGQSGTITLVFDGKQ